jgi:hypothetical protein
MTEYEVWQAILILGYMLYGGGVIIKMIFFPDLKPVSSTSRLIPRDTGSSVKTFGNWLTIVIAYLAGGFLIMLGIWSAVSGATVNDLSSNGRVFGLILGVFLLLTGGLSIRWGRRIKRRLQAAE